MNFSINLPESLVQKKGKYLPSTGKPFDYYLVESEQAYFPLVSLGELVRGDILQDFYQDPTAIPVEPATREFIKLIHPRSIDSPFNDKYKIEVSATLVRDFCQGMLKHYTHSKAPDGYYSLTVHGDYPDLVNGFNSTLHRFSVNGNQYKVDTYETIDSDLHEAEYFINGEKTVNINLHEKQTITIEGRQFRVVFTTYQDDKIKKIKELETLLEVSEFYFGPACGISLTRG